MKEIFVAKMIITMDSSHPFATHVAVDDGKIVGLGDKEIIELFPDFTLNEQFKDNTILPGFIEGHAHMVAGQDGLGAYVGYFDRPSPDGGVLKGLKSMEEITSYLIEFEKKLPANEPIIATGFDPIYFNTPRPTASDLDKISQDRMIFLMHASGHLITVNSKVLTTIPQDKLTTDGVAKDTSGKPTGELQEIAAMTLALGAMGEAYLKFTDPKVLFPRYVKLAQMAGVTTITEMGVDINLDDEKAIELLTQLTQNSPVRIVPMYFVPTATRKPEEQPAYVKSLIGRSTDKLRFGNVKFMADGSIQGYTARVKQPYVNGVQNGMWNMDPEKIKMFTKLYNNEGLSINCHCNGDEASDVFINAVSDALLEKPWSDNRHTIQHAQMADTDQFHKMKRLGMGANIFTNHIYYWGDQHASKTIGQERADKMDAANTALSLGVPFSLHCDASVTPIAPLFNAWTAVNRLTATGKTLGENEKIPVQDALYAMTMGTAYLLRLDKELGSITIGKTADFVVLETDPYTVDPIKLKDIKVVTTVSGGIVSKL